MKQFRTKIYSLLENPDKENKYSRYYNYFMMAVIFISIVPLALKNAGSGFALLERVCTILFIIDYILRIMTADFKLDRGRASFVIYPFTPMAIVDLLSILPSLTILNNALRLFRLFRLFRTLRLFRVFRIFRAARYSKSVAMIREALYSRRVELLTVYNVAVVYVLVVALIALNLEPDAFNSYFDAVYWAVISLTTVGYGDIYMTSVLGRILTVVSAFMGIAIVALPSGIITAAFMDTIDRETKTPDGENGNTVSEASEETKGGNEDSNT